MLPTVMDNKTLDFMDPSKRMRLNTRTGGAFSMHTNGSSTWDEFNEYVPFRLASLGTSKSSTTFSPMPSPLVTSPLSHDVFAYSSQTIPPRFQAKKYPIMNTSGLQSSGGFQRQSSMDSVVNQVCLPI